MNNLYLGLILASLIAYLVIHRLLQSGRTADDSQDAHMEMARQQRRDTTELSAKLDVVTDELALIETKIDKIRNVLPGRMHKTPL